MAEPVAIAVADSSMIGEARRAAAHLARTLGFDETGCGNAAIVATEAAGNLVKHARQGTLLLRPLERGQALGIEVLALDSGPGMADVARCLRDGYSTAGSPGTGLGAIARMASTFDIYSTVPGGTVLLARLWSESPDGRGPTRFRTGAVSVPKAGEDVCGDAWTLEQVGGGARVLVADGLGHGPFAADAARTAVRVFRDNRDPDPGECLRAIHNALRGTRGAAAAVALVDLDRQVIRYAGVGNIAGAVLAGGVSRSMVSHSGIVGHQARHFQEFLYPFPAGALLVMHSDGLASRWSLDAYPGLVAKDPALIAGVLHRDFQRGRDDATVLAAREVENAA